MKALMCVAILSTGLAGAKSEVLWQNYDGVTVGPEVLYVSRGTSQFGYTGDRKAWSFLTRASACSLQSITLHLTKDPTSTDDVFLSIHEDAGGVHP